MHDNARNCTIGAERLSAIYWRLHELRVRASIGSGIHGLAGGHARRLHPGNRTVQRSEKQTQVKPPKNLAGEAEMRKCSTFMDAPATKQTHCGPAGSMSGWCGDGEMC
jgi:hypothetical protein